MRMLKLKARARDSYIARYRETWPTAFYNHRSGSWSARANDAAALYAAVHCTC